MSKPRLSPWEIVKESKLSVAVRASDRGIDSVEITISGPAADIPSLKNSKLPGTNHISPNTHARIQALDSLWCRGGNERNTFAFIEKIHVIAIFGKRKVAFDEDNAFATVRDWLEPPTKRVGRNATYRGWGIGLIQNDNQVIGYPIKAEDIGIPTTDTKILIQRWDLVKDHSMQFIDRCFS